jgi:hypothetical protein
MIDYNNILAGDEADFLFDDQQEEAGTEEDTLFASLEEESIKTVPKQDKTTTESEEVEEDESSESVGDEEDTEDQSGENANVANPSPRFYASIAKALADEGVFSDFDFSEEDIKNVKTAEDFVNLGKKWSQAIRDADDQRILEATKSGVEPNRIRQYEQTLRQLDAIESTNLKQEGQEGDQIRKQIIYQDYINRGFSQERALKAAERSFTAGTDMDDAVESLASVKEYFQNAYKEEIAESQAKQNEHLTKIKKESDQLKKEMLESTELINGIKVDKATRQKAYDALIKPVAKLPDGTQVTAIQKFEQDNPVQFRKALGVLYVVTDGFKNISNIVKQQAKAEARKGMNELERTLRSSGSTRLDGSFQLAGGTYDDPESTEGFILA